MKYLWILLIVLFLSFNARAGELESTEVAKIYFESLFSGNLEVAMEVVDIPYSFDRKKIIKNKKDLFELHKRLTSYHKKVPAYLIEKGKRFTKLDPSEFKEKYDVVRFNIDGEGINIYTQKKGENYKVIGFSD
ncbi:MAG: hypothetical protein GY714_13725 [Desulfobacterales bacterium]|nr:hypothetical protein [Desulfobacterales bacterium]